MYLYIFHLLYSGDNEPLPLDIFEGTEKVGEDADVYRLRRKYI